jgi:hypothetical protein
MWNREPRTKNHGTAEPVPAQRAVPQQTRGTAEPRVDGTTVSFRKDAPPGRLVPILFILAILSAIKKNRRRSTSMYAMQSRWCRDPRVR